MILLYLHHACCMPFLCLIFLFYQANNLPVLWIIKSFSCILCTSSHHNVIDVFYFRKFFSVPNFQEVSLVFLIDEYIWWIKEPSFKFLSHSEEKYCHSCGLFITERWEKVYCKPDTSAIHSFGTVKYKHVYFISDLFPEENLFIWSSPDLCHLLICLTAAWKWVRNTDETIFKNKTEVLGKKLVSFSPVTITNFVRTGMESKPVLL
jgi:hypothetical protein